MAAEDITLRVRQTGAEATASDLERLAREVDGLGRMRARPRIEPRGIDQGTKSLREATRQSVSLGKGLGGAHRGALLLRGALVGLAGAQVTRGLWATVTAASDLTEAGNRAITVFGRDGVQAVQRFSKISSQAFGISRREFQDTAGTFGAMLIPLGVLPKRAADMSVAMTKLAGDLSSFHNANPSDVLMDLRSGLAGETEPLRKFGISLNDARLKAEALRLGLSDGKATLDANAKAQAAYSLIMSDAQKTGAVGDFARTQGQLANQLRVARAATEDAAVGFGKILQPAVRSGVRYLTREVLPAVQAFGNDLSKVFERDDLSPAEKWSKSWEMLKDTGLPAAAKEAIYDGMVEVGTRAPGIMLRAMAEAPWPAKAILGAMLVRRFGPVFSLLGSRAVDAIGAARGGGGGGGGLAGGLSGGPVPVIVTNPGFGGKGPGGVPLPYPGAPGGGPAGTAARGGRLARYGAGASRFGAAALGLGGVPGAAPAVGAAAAFAAPIAAGYGISKLDEKYGFLGPSKAEAAKRVREINDAQIAAWKEGSAKFKAEVIRQNPFANVSGKLDAEIPKLRKSLTRMEDAVRETNPRVRRSAQAMADEVLARFREMPPRAQKLGADTVINLVSSMERRGKVAKGSTAKVVKGVTDTLGELPTAAQRAADNATGKLDRINRKLSDIRSAAQMAADSVRKVGSSGTTVGDFGLATGGIIPGVYRGVDTITARLAPGERVARPDQVAAIDRAAGIPGLVDATIMRMGGRIGGTAFAAGGVASRYVHPAPGTKMGGGPSAHHSRALGNWMSDDAWDLMGGNQVLAAFTGQWTKRGFSSNPQTWGYGAYLTGPAGSLYYKHMRSAVGSGTVKAGQVVGYLGDGVNGGRHLHLGANPVSLGEAVLAGRRINGSGDGGDVGGERTEEKSEMESMLDFTRAGGLANRKNIGAPRGGRYASTGIDGRPGTTTKNPRPTGIARSSGVAIARDLMTDTPDLSGSIDTSPSGRESLAIKRAGSGAAARARAAGKSPEEVAEDRKKAEDDELRKFYRRQRALTVKRVRQCQAEIKRLTRVINETRKSKRGTKAGRARLIRALRKEILDWRTELGEVLDVLASIDEALLDLNDAASDEAYSTSKLEGGDDGGASDTANAQAEERAAAEAARAEVFRGRSDASGQILRGISGSGSIDPGAGGGGITVNVNVGGSLVTQQDVAGWLVGALGNQPGSRRATGTVGV